MAEPVIKDIALTVDGDVSVASNGDLDIVRDEDAVAQEIAFRLKTFQGDWVLEPACGADLELLIGMPNSPDTGAQMESQITRALIHDGFLLGELTTVRAVPINREQLAGIVIVEYGDRSLTNTVTLDLKEGILS